MSVTVNQEEKQFVIKTFGGYSCHGFDVVWNEVQELARRIKAVGLSLKTAEPTKEAWGTLEQYQQYQHLCEQYSTINDAATWYDARTPQPVQAIFEKYRLSGERLRVHLGDSESGLDWLEESECIGRIGRSMGPMKVPLMLLSGQYGGSAILTHCVVRLADAKTGTLLWTHKTYTLPKLKVGPNPMEASHPFGVFVEKKTGDWCLHAAFKTEDKARAFLSFISGKTNSKR